MASVTTPGEVISGESIELHRFTANCITDEYLSWLNNRELMRFSRQSRLTHSRESCLHYVNSFIDSSNYFWSVRNKSGLQIGTMTAYLDQVSSVADIGIMIAHESVRGHGAGEAAWGLAMAFLFESLNLRKLTGGTLAPHKSMIRIFQKWGMQQEALLREQELLHDVVYDVVRYGITKHQWMKLAHKPTIQIL